jgi:hypothetical protein
MRWRKRGLVLTIEHRSEWMWSHAAVPTGFLVDENVLRVFVGARDGDGRTRTAFFDCRADDPSEILYVHDRPVLDLGPLGTFDDSGVMPSCVIEDAGHTYLYYVGWNRGVTVPYQNSIGLAVRDDDGITFSRVFEGPIVARSAADPYFTTTPFVLKEGSLWRMWYSSCTGWLSVQGKPEPVYEIKYAESADGAEWQPANRTCIEPRNGEEANTRPWVILGSGVYRMWYCFRESLDYRTDKRHSYRIGYAESVDGLNWERKDDEAGIDRSESGWDSFMIAYPCVYEHRNQTFLLYNGNGFGETGVGYAVLEDA